ncbi:MAG: hypothetical protein DWQ07_07900 [Chloroflexi bacterium]|nr:MAG: hypothetical protein DWQ07_07900 [Chloroflexota bacterium]MBL1197039.1 hypothetical protein [Chloroflexota bacterium]NOH14334.1 hypothetical protein [Chloroflexota bacterium]
MKRIYLWLIPLSFVWPIIHLIIFYYQFQKLPPNGIIEAVAFLPFGLLAAFIFLFAWDRSSDQRQKWLSVLGYLLAAPFAFIGSLGGGLLNIYIGPLLFGSIPLGIGTFLGYYVGKYLSRQPVTD